MASLIENSTNCEAQVVMVMLMVTIIAPGLSTTMPSPESNAAQRRLLHRRPE